MPKPIEIKQNQVVLKTKEEKIQERLDALAISAEKNSSGIYNIFTLYWSSLADVLESGDKLRLERTDFNQALEYAILTASAVNYKDQDITSELNRTYAYRLEVDLANGQKMFSKQSVSAMVTKDPVLNKPVPPKVIEVNNQRAMLEKYLNGFKVLWIDDSDNETKFEIEKCVSELGAIVNQEGQTVSTYEVCTPTGSTITVNTSGDPTFKGNREYFDSDVSPSMWNDQPGEYFTSSGYCYQIRAVNAAGASTWTSTECRRFE